MKKLSLKELKVNSFVTAVDEKLAETAKGGGKTALCNTQFCSAYLGCPTNGLACTRIICPTGSACTGPITGKVACPSTQAPYC